MQRVLVMVLVSVISLQQINCAESNALLPSNIDIWFVRDLLQDLRKENFSDRELATRRLIAIGPAVLHEIEDAADYESPFDAETNERLDRVRRNVEFSYLATFSDGAAEYERLIAEIAALDPAKHASLIATKRERAERMLVRLEELAGNERRYYAVADLLSATGQQLFYSRFSASKTLLLRYAIADLQSAVMLYEQALNKRPDDPALLGARKRAAALLGSARWMESPRFE